MQGPVKVYALSTCIHCRHAKEFLDENGVQYESVFVDTLQGQQRKDTIAEIKKVNPTLSFPTILIGEKVLVGFDRVLLAKELEV